MTWGRKAVLDRRRALPTTPAPQEREITVATSVPRLIASEDLGDLLHRIAHRGCKRLGRIVAVAFWAALLVAVTISAIRFIDSAALLLTSLISSAVLVVTAPKIRQCHPIRITSSHVIAMTIGIGVHCILPANAISISAAVAISLIIVLLLDVFHPPAMANAAFPFVAETGSGAELLGLAAGSGLILSLAAVLNARCNLDETGYVARVARRWSERRVGLGWLRRSDA